MNIDERLKSIAPMWYGKITRARTISGLLNVSKVNDDGYVRELNLALPHACMCEESHGFDAAYYNHELKPENQVTSGCPSCTFYSSRVYWSIKTDFDYEEFQRLISLYLSHVQRDHGVQFT